MERDHLLTTDSHKSWSKLMWHLTGAHPKFVVFLEYFNSHRHGLHVAWVLSVEPYSSVRSRNISILIYFQDERRFHHCCHHNAEVCNVWRPAVAHAEILTLIFKIKARLQDGAADHCFHYESMCWCESLYSSRPSSDIDPYPHNCMSTCMWGYVAP